MTTVLKAATLWMLLASSAFAQSNVNISVTLEEVSVDRITAVQVEGGGLFQFADPFTAPALTEPEVAIAAALAGLGYPVGTVATVQSSAIVGTEDTFVEIVNSNYNPTDDPTYVIGDPDDYLTWIAIGDEDVNVEAFQTVTHYTFHQLVVAIVAPCGDGVVQPGETCDDGNTNDGDCCSSACQYESAGSACDDGVVCTALDTCDGAGACQAGGPATACAESWAKANLVIKESKPGKEKLIAKMTGGPALAQSDFGDPLMGSTAYDVCLFDDGGTLVASLRVDRAGGTCAGKPCWKASKDTGWQYQDKEAASDGVTKLKLAGGVAGKSQLQLQAANNATKGQTSLPTGLAAALQASTSATLQLVASDAQCFAVTVDQIKKQAADAFTGLRK